jgi:hypothetical protein
MAVLGSQDGSSKYSRRTKLERLRGQLDMERTSFKSHWRDLNDYILPRRGRFFITDVNKGDRRNHKIIDSTATLALRTLRSGMMGGLTSPARPWFRLGIQDYDLYEFGPVRQWLDEATRKMQGVFLRSNLYNVLPICYGDLGVFGTAPISMMRDPISTVRFESYPVGSYMIANNERNIVNVFVREFRMTVRQVVNMFGKNPEKPGSIDWTNISTKVKSLYETNHPEAWVDIVHVIMPNENHDPNKLGAKYKKFISVYYETGFSGQNQQSYFSPGVEEDKFLRESGFDYFPVLCPRWELTGEDVYGTESPGMVAIGDVKQLQTGERRGLQAVDKMINPPMIGPTSLRNTKASILPGDITYVDDRQGMQGFRPAHEVNFNLQALEMKQDQVRQRISRAFYEDLFLMLANTDRRQITAREIEERHEEKLLALGPVLEQLNQDLLDPLIENTFQIMMEDELLPPPPEELQGQELKIEYISIMAQAQKLVGLGSVERFAGFAANVAAQAPEAGDKIDTDQLIDVYADIVSLPSGIVRSDQAVEEIRMNRAKIQAEQVKREAAAQEAQTIKDLGQAKLSDDRTALDVVREGIG